MDETWEDNSSYWEKREEFSKDVDFFPIYWKLVVNGWSLFILAFFFVLHIARREKRQKHNIIEISVQRKKGKE